MMFSSKRCIACAIGASCIASEEMIPGIQRVVSDAGPSDESEFGDPIEWSFRAYLRSTKGGSSHVHRFWWVIPLTKPGFLYPLAMCGMSHQVCFWAMVQGIYPENHSYSKTPLGHFRQLPLADSYGNWRSSWEWDTLLVETLLGRIPGLFSTEAPSQLQAISEIIQDRW